MGDKKYKKKESKEKEKKDKMKDGKKESKKGSKKDPKGKDDKKDKKKKNEKDKGKSEKDKKSKEKSNKSPWHWYSCSFKGCPTPIFASPSERLAGKYPACKAHRCGDEDCWRIMLTGSRYCIKHTCGFESCRNRCPKSRETCGNHKLCDLQGCLQHCMMGNQGNERPFCSDHMCAFGRSDPENCNLSKARDVQHCTRHQCGSPLGCSKPAYQGAYCEDHLCRASGCGSRADGQGHCKPCAARQQCQYEYCDRVGDYIKTDLVKKVYFCPDHEKRLCPGFGTTDAPYCGERIVDWWPFCYGHRCRAEGRRKIKDINMLVHYCEDHRCGQRGCSEPKQAHSSHCPDHTG